MGGDEGGEVAGGADAAASNASFATFAISQTAQRKTVGPSWRRVGHSETPSRNSVSVWFMPTASALEPSEPPQTAREMPGVSLGPMTAAPAPSPRRNEMLRSVGSTTSESFSAPITRAYRATPVRMSASAWVTA